MLTSTLLITMVSQMFTVAGVLGMCYVWNVHAFSGQRVIRPEEVAALSSAVISDQTASSSSFVQDGDACAYEKNHGNFEGE